MEGFIMKKVAPLLLSGFVVGVGVSKAADGISKLSPEEMKKAAQLYFDRCAGCHGMLRGGATGPSLEPKIMKQRGIDYLKWIIHNGTPGGMPDWGKQGVLSEDEIDLVAKFLMHEPPPPPEMSLKDMLATWYVYIPPENRPNKPRRNNQDTDACYTMS